MADPVADTAGGELTAKTGTDDGEPADAPVAQPTPMTGSGPAGSPGHPPAGREPAGGASAGDTPGTGPDDLGHEPAEAVARPDDLGHELAEADTFAAGPAREPAEAVAGPDDLGHEPAEADAAAAAGQTHELAEADTFAAGPAREPAEAVAGPDDLGHEPAEADTAEDMPLIADTAQIHVRWQEIQITFVDDPHGSVQRAASLAAEVAGALAAAAQDRMRELRTGWDDNADTEKLRNALRRYRALIGRLSAA